MLIANLAFSYYRGGVLELTIARWSAPFAVWSTRSTGHTGCPAADARASAWKIVVVGSASALRGRAGISLYAAARGAQHAYVCNAAVKFAPHVPN